MARGYTGPTLKLSQSPTRRGASGLFSVYATAAGGLGAAIFSAFTYHMLRNKKGPFVSLWVVSIFRVLKWLVGMLHIVALSQGQSPTQLPLCPNHIHYAVRMQLLGFRYHMAKKVLFVYGTRGDVGGDMAAGHLHEASEKGSPVSGLDTSIIIKEHAHEEIA
ncbi:hypothetical protein KPL71_014977 [Citrus sinensis]|uniref:Uncharacterized protein n=1 Tax=Citrus sinensis TaxID=2711 RepID=A0ACB8KFP9_CITSI|nr:hypothetical protein KPL71_014977 [Citrus sinensis]